MNLNEYKYIPAVFAQFLQKTSLSESLFFSALFSDLKSYLLTKCQSPAEVSNYCQLLQSTNQYLEPDSPLAPLCLTFVSENIAVFVQMLQQNLQATQKNSMNKQALLNN